MIFSREFLNAENILIKIENLKISKKNNMFFKAVIPYLISKKTKIYIDIKKMDSYFDLIKDIYYSIDKKNIEFNTNFDLTKFDDKNSLLITDNSEYQFKNKYNLNTFEFESQKVEIKKIVKKEEFINSKLDIVFIFHEFISNELKDKLITELDKFKEKERNDNKVLFYSVKAKKLLDKNQYNLKGDVDDYDTTESLKHGLKLILEYVKKDIDYNKNKYNIYLNFIVDNKNSKITSSLSMLKSLVEMKKVSLRILNNTQEKIKLDFPHEVVLNNRDDMLNNILGKGLS